MMHTLPFPGVYAASLIPIQPNMSCDTPALVDHCKDLLTHGCDGIALFGTTGEGPSFSVNERQRVIQECVRLGIPAQKIIVGVLCSALDDALNLIQTAIHNQCAGVLIAPPFYFKDLTETEILAYYREVIKRINSPDLRVILYHIPQFTKITLTLDIIKALHMEFPNTVVAMKDSEGNMSLVSDIVKIFPRFKIFMGREQLISEAMQSGAIGAISGIANIAPSLIRSLVLQTDKSNHLEVIFNGLKGYPTIPALKSILHEKKGGIWNRVLPPLLPLTNTETIDLIKKVVAAGIIA